MKNRRTLSLTNAFGLMTTHMEGSKQTKKCFKILDSSCFRMRSQASMRLSLPMVKLDLENLTRLREPLQTLDCSKGFVKKSLLKRKNWKDLTPITVSK